MRFKDAPRGAPDVSTWLRLCGFGLLLTLLVSCSHPVQRRYYTMALPPAVAPAESKHAADLWVKEVDVAPVYNRPQIVYRYSPTELEYYSIHLWADRPARIVSQLVLQALRGAGLFRTVQERLGTTPPKYVFESSVEAIEELDGGTIWYAHLAMTMRMSRFDDNRVLWQYTFDERKPLTRSDIDLIVRAVSDIFREQMDIVRPQLDAVLEGKPLPPLPPKVAAPVESVTATPTDIPPEIAGEPGGDRGKGQGATAPRGTVVPPADPDPVPRQGERAGAASDSVVSVSSPHTGVVTRVDWRQSAQFYSDKTVVPAGMGAVFLPALSQDPDREPPVQIFKNGELIASGSMGRRIPVAPGQYEVFLGSGTLSQRMMRKVKVREGDTSVVPPDWSALEVSVVNEKFIPFRGSFELIRMQDHEYMGQGYGADEELGELTMIWVIESGLYKIIQSGSTYRARTNFATVLLQSGAMVPYTLVQDETSRDFLGAGVSEVGPNDSREKKWSLRASLGGTIFLNDRSKGFTNDYGSSVSMGIYSDNLLRFSSEPHLWTTRLEIEETQALKARTNLETNEPNSLFQSPLQSIQTDRLYLNSIYVYHLLRWVGPYVRIGGESSLLDHTDYFDKTTVVQIQDSDGKPIDHLAGAQNEGIDSFHLASPLSPIELKQGAGVNFRLLHNTVLDLDLRTGLGSRQYLTRGEVLLATDVVPDSELAQYGDVPVKAFKQGVSFAVAGPETTILATARITRYVQATTEFDAIVPFQGLDQTQFNWRSSVSLRLGTWAALTYTLNLEKNPQLPEDQPVAREQGIQLRFYYAPF